MITALLLLILYGTLILITAPIRFLPDATLPGFITGTFTEVAGYVSSMNAIFPVGEVLIVIGFVILIEAGLFLFKLIRWIYKKIPTIS